MTNALRHAGHVSVRLRFDEGTESYANRDVFSMAPRTVGRTTGSAP